MAKSKKEVAVEYGVTLATASEEVYEGPVTVNGDLIEVLSKKFRSKKYIRQVIPMGKVISYVEGEDGYVRVRSDSVEVDTLVGTVGSADNGFMTVTDEDGMVTVVNPDFVTSVEAEEDAPEAGGKKAAPKKEKAVAPKKGGKKASADEEEDDDEDEDSEDEDEEEEEPKSKKGAKAKKAPAKKGGKKAPVEEEDDDEDEDEDEEEEEDDDDEDWD